uniref:Cystatin domain-containing protein n=1 Tax=Strongyloides venezuelensis TaxID=75913 RepID=A0A0K0G4F4_STRVS
MIYLKIPNIIICAFLLTNEIIPILGKSAKIFEFRPINPNSKLIQSYGKKSVEQYNKENKTKNKFVSVKKARKEFNGQDIHYELLVSTTKGNCSSKKKGDCSENLESDVFQSPKEPNNVVLEVLREGQCAEN